MAESEGAGLTGAVDAVDSSTNGDVGERRRAGLLLHGRCAMALGTAARGPLLLGRRRRWGTGVVERSTGGAENFGSLTALFPSRRRLRSSSIWK